MSAEKKNGNGGDSSDHFWSRILIVAVVVVWLALVGGNWIGHYMIKAGIFSKRSSAQGGEFRMMPPSKPKPWQQPVKVITPTAPPVKEFETPETVDETKAPEVKPSETPADVTPPKPSPTPEEKRETPEPKPSPSPSPRPKPSPPPRPSPTPRPSPSPTPAREESDSGSYTLQCGSFDQDKNALELVGKLKDKGYSATIAKVGNNYKVYVGNYNDRKKAQDAQAKLKTDGFDTFAVSNQ